MSKKKNKGGRPLKFKSIEELQNKIKEYFESCWTQKIDMFGNPVFIKDEKGKKSEKAVMVQFKPYTITGLAVFLETTRDTLMDYQGKKQFSDTIKRAKEMCHAYSEEQLFLARNATGAIFNLKNNYKWTDEQKIDHTSLGESIAPKVVSEITPHVKPKAEATPGDTTSQ